MIIILSYERVYICIILLFIDSGKARLKASRSEAKIRQKFVEDMK